jgi:hypothetical protein
VELWTGKPFVEGVGRISVIGANGPHFIASGCHDNYTGALIVPVYWNHKTNLASGPTGGNAKLDLNWNLKFYVRTTNPPSLTFEYFDTDYTTKPWWACSNTSNGVEIGGLGSPDVTVKKQLSQLRAVSENTTVAKSENFDYLLGYFVITNWKSSRWKSYIAGKAQIQFPIVQVPSMNERITHFTGSGLSIDKSPMNNSPYQYLWDPLVGLGTSFQRLMAGPDALRPHCVQPRSEVGISNRPGIYSVR